MMHLPHDDSGGSDYLGMAEFMDLFGEYALRTTAAPYYSWRFDQNPYAQGYLYLECDNSHIIGSASITPKQIVSGGKIHGAAEIGDTFTHPDYRRQGIFTRGVKACTQYALANDFQVVYGTPNPISLPGYQKKLGYPPSPAARVQYLCKYFHAKPLMRWLQRRIKPEVLAQLGAEGFFRYLQMKSRIQRSMRHIASQRLEIQLVISCPDDLDGTWGDGREDHAFFTLRDKKYLDWRYFGHPDSYIVLAAIEAGIWRGYVTAKISTDHSLVIGTICDFVAWEDRVDIFAELLRAVENRLRTAGAHYIQTLCCEKSPYFPVLLSAGYVIRRATPVIVFSGTELGNRMTQEEGRWHFTYGDSDMV